MSTIHYIVIDRQHSAGLAIQYPNLALAEDALTDSPFIDGLCAEDCLDAYTYPEAPEGFEVVIPPDETK